MSTTEPRLHDTFSLTPAPAGWTCTAYQQEDRVLHPDAGDECWGDALIEYKVRRISDGQSEQTYKAACQRIGHRQAVTAHVRKLYPEVTFDENRGVDETAPLLFNKPVPEPEPEPTSVMLELPGHSNLQRRTLEYLLGNDGSVGTRYAAFQHLAEADAFYPGRSERQVTEAIEELLSSNPMGACSDGIARFRDALGLAPVRRRFRADLMQSGGSDRLATVTWVAETDDVSEAEDTFTNQVSLSDIDAALRSALYDHDGGEANIDFSSSFDVVLVDIEDLGPVD